ncbi:MAG: AMIN domain-containing protein, partial [bacterium]|nr:AMIN domain-containing protein [bacterium]
MKKQLVLIIIGCILCLGVGTPFHLAAAEANQAILQSISTKVESSVFKVFLKISGPVTPKDFVKADPDPKLVLDLINTRNASDFKKMKVNLSPILYLRATQYKITPQPITRVVLDLTATPAYEIKTSADGLEINVTLDQDNTMATDPAAAQIPPETTNPRLFSFDFENADVKDVLYALGLKKGINIIIDEDVTGQISISLNNISFEDSLDTILKIKSLSLTKISDQVIRISKKEKADLVTTFVQLKFGRAEDTAPLVTPLLSGKGNIQVDKRTNSLLITDALNNIQVITDALSKMDLKPNVVEIKAEIVEVDTNALRELGISWTAAKEANPPTGTGMTYNAA